MRDSLKHKIVEFISKLTPLYTFEHVGRVVCARSLVDGTLILPNGNIESDEPEENLDELDDYDLNENDFVTVYWQGDSSRKSVVHGLYMASIAVARYAEIHAIPQIKETKFEYSHMANHFTVKTGEGLTIRAADEDSDLYAEISRGIKSFGKDALIALIKAKIGI